MTADRGLFLQHYTPQRITIMLITISSNLQLR